MRAGHVGLRWLLALGLLGQASAARSDPVIVGDEAMPECLAALAIAKQVFRSTQASLVWPLETPAGIDARIVLRRDVEQSGGAALHADPAVFDRIEPRTGSAGTVFWQRRAVDGKRVVVVDQPHSWRGDWYFLYSLDGSLAQAEFLREIAGRDGLTQAFTPVLGDNRWDPPVILRTALSRSLWVIDQGQPYSVIGDWHVLTVAAEGMTSPCRIDFTPEEEPGLGGLPRAVQRFASLADEALGPGANEGTLQSTARIRLAVSKDWARVSERPWALTNMPYNSRAEVDAGLRVWARRLPARERVRQALQHSYKASERALADYYEGRFGVTVDTARRFSAYAMDHMLRRYFIFHSDNPGSGVSATPWPPDIR